MEVTLKLARLMRYARSRANSPGEANAEKWRRVFHFTVQLLPKAVAGEIAPERLAPLDEFFGRYATDPRMDGGAGSGNWGHEGRPGQRGGSAPGGGAHNRMAAENGGFTSFAKIQKSYATPHTFNASDSGSGQISWKTNGAKLIVSGTTYAYHPKSDTFEGPDGTLYSASRFNGQTVKVLVPNSASPNYSKAKNSVSVEEGKKKFEAAFNPSSAQEADNAYRAKSGEVWRDCDKATKEALSNYTFGGYVSMNKALRDGNKGSSHTAAEIDRVTDAISKSVLDKDCVFYRGMGTGAFEKMMHMEKGTLTKDSVKDLVGRSGDDKGFMSAGSMEGTGFYEKQVNLDILAPKGTQALYVEPFSSCGDGDGKHWDSIRTDGKSSQKIFSSELETIIQRGSSVLVVSAEYDWGHYHVKAVITGQDLSLSDK